MASISVAALLAILALVGVTSARPGGTDGATADGNGHGRVQLQQPDHTALEEVAIPLYRAADTKSPHKEHSGGGKLSIVHLIMIIGKVIAPLVGAIVEPLLINIVKGITWAITYSLASAGRLFAETVTGTGATADQYRSLRVQSTGPGTGRGERREKPRGTSGPAPTGRTSTAAITTGRSRDPKRSA
ncbi:Hypothetical protein CINCED_3A025001 [Cinara cedri]|uniref:Uncharacterized protein n=1 Tax=Cinara cedri TaxID=506608 RepID=A0A5E4MQD1_9HEMI|nr:Hypothetical protein CINCED_3A025001 [Cinara cedri]